MLDKNLKQHITTCVIKHLYEQYNHFDTVVCQDDYIKNSFNQFLGSFFSKDHSLEILVNNKIHITNKIFPFVSEKILHSFYTEVSYILSGGESMSYLYEKDTNLPIEQTQKDTIIRIITNLTNGNQSPSLANENNLIFQKPNTSNLIEGTDFTADVFFESTTEIICIEIKTVKPNKGVFKVEKQKILEAKAALKLKYPTQEIKYFLAFPFDPLSDTPCGYDKKRFMDYSVGFTKYFDEAEILLAGELWDYLSGVPNTMEAMIHIINTIATPNFLNELYFLNDSQNSTTQTQNYLDLLERWCLFQEHELVKHAQEIIPKLTNRQLQSLYYQSCFRGGEYQWQRVQTLLELR